MISERLRYVPNRFAPKGKRLEIRMDHEQGQLLAYVTFHFEMQAANLVLLDGVGTALLPVRDEMIHTDELTARLVAHAEEIGADE